MQQKSAAKPISHTALLVSDLASRVVGTASTAPPPLDINRSPTLVLQYVTAWVVSPKSEKIYAAAFLFHLQTATIILLI